MTCAAFDGARATVESSQHPGTLAGVTLPPGTYCVDATEKTGTLTLDGGGDVNAQWIFLVGSPVAGGALTGANFSVAMAGGGLACTVVLWGQPAAPMATPDFLVTHPARRAIQTRRRRRP